MGRRSANYPPELRERAVRMAAEVWPDADSLLFARALTDKGVPVPEIAEKLTGKNGKNGKNGGKAPSGASLYRSLAEADERDAPGRGGDHRTAPLRTREDRRAWQRHP